MVLLPGTIQEPGCGALDQLQAGQGRLTDLSIQGVAVIQARGYKGVDDFLKIFGCENRLDFGNRTKLEKT